MIKAVLFALCALCFVGVAEAQVAIAPSSFSFGAVTFGTPSNSSNLVLTNNSGSTITFAGNAFAGPNGPDFTVFSNGCVGSLTTGNSCPMVIRFLPSQTPGTNESATLQVNYISAPGSPIQVPLTGMSAAAGSVTAISAQVIDSDTIQWANGNWSVSFVPNPAFSGQYQYQGHPFTPQLQKGVMDASGNLSVSVPANNFITPSGTQWAFVICPNASAQCTTFTTPVTGTSLNFTTLFSNVKAPRFATSAGSFGYSNVEVTPIPLPGGFYYNVQLLCQEVWSGTSFSCGTGGGGTATNLQGPGSINGTFNGNATLTGTLSCGPGCVISTSGGTINATTAITAQSLSAPSALPAGTTAQTNSCLDNSTLIATDAFVLGCSSGGGGSPAGNNGDVQIKNGTSFAAGGENDNGSTLNINRNQHNLGPDPWNDICLYGALCDNPASSTTATTNGTTAVTVASAANFLNGQGVTIYNAGASPTITALGTVTLTPSLNAGGMNTVAANAGSTSYSYKVVAANKFGGFLPATSAVSTTTANVLGMKSINITSMARSGLTVTVTTAAAHPFVVGTEIYIKYNSTNTDRTFNGFFLVTAAPDNTHFSFLQGFDTTLGATTSDTGGVAVGFVTNTLSWTAVAGAFRYYIYGRTTGGYSLIGQTLDQFWVDYGSPMNDNQSFPAYIPTTAPSSGANDHLTTKIVSGGGTTSLVLANAAGVSGSNTILSDDGPAIKSACATSQSCYIPNSGARINSYTSLAGGTVRFWMAGTLQLADTIEFGSSSAIDCLRGGSNASFAWIGCAAAFAGTTAYPVISVTGNGVSFNRMSVNSNAQNGALLMADYADNGIGGPVTNVTIDNSTMNTSTSAVDYLGQQMIWQSDGFGFRFDKNEYGTGSPGANANTSIGNSPIPSIVFKNQLGAGGAPTGNLAFTRSWFVARTSVDQDFSFNSGGINYMIFQDIETQNSFLPQAMVTGTGCCPGGNVDIENISGADFPTAFWANLSPTSATLNMRIQQVTPVQGSYFNTTGQQMIPVESFDASPGQNGNIRFAPNFFTNLPVNVMGSGNIGFAMPPPPAPTVAISGASGPPANTYKYSLAAVDTGGRTSTPGAESSPITVNGSQGVLVTFGTASPGQVASTICRSAGGSAVCATVGSGFQITGTTFLDNGGFFPNQSTNQTNTGAASTVINANGSATFAQKLVGGGFAQTTTGTFTAARAVTAPDLGGIQGLTATLTTCNPLFNAGGLITSTPSVFLVECYGGTNPQDQVNNCITAALAVNGACDLGAWTVGHPKTFTGPILANLTTNQRLTLILPASCDWKVNITNGTDSLFEIGGGSVKFDDSRTAQYSCQIQNISPANGLFAFVTTNNSTTNYTAVRGLFINNAVATASTFDIEWNGSVDNSYIQNNQITDTVGSTQGEIFVGGGTNTVCCGMFIDHNVLYGSDLSNVILQITAASNLYSIFVTNNSIGHPGVGKFNFQCTDGAGHVSHVVFADNYEELTRSGPATVATNSNAGCGLIDVYNNVSGAFIASTTSPLWTSTGNNIQIHSAFMHRVTNSYVLPATVLSNSNNLACSSLPCLIKTDSVGVFGELSIANNYFAGMQVGNTTYSSAHTATIFETNIDVTGATTISIDPTLLYSFWNVTNVGAGSVTVAPLSGTINGSASLTLAANAMVTNIHCNGTNCWAKQ